MPSTEQLLFPFPSLDFEGRTALYPHEVATKLGMSTDQVHDLAEDNSMPALDIGSKDAGRRALRIPIESYRNFIVTRMTGPLQTTFLKALPEATVRHLVREMALMIPLHSRRELLRELLRT